ncbi:YggS family pyridoxal phosphate-dependent enzyme [candidate division LCP-89 bacterium B3_LCP]|uniref:Pyridoxal phosphate homeostasis protein n=1 Tax=candidate division LCP-89 bacterium B3_LCP TaxID=2012998 RepID=A0A532UZT1_UNCL8|nr:MAG: YggS family pyridoxal phosphate-dependent enzyme [candidate division LCP-89 bacterium B3_LCP]
MRLADNVKSVLERVQAAAICCSRNHESIKLVAVSKRKDVGLMREALESGITALGENRVQEAREKWPQIAEYLRLSDYEFHMVGHLQRNKAKEAVQMFDLIHSVDSERLALEIDRRAEEIDKKQRVLVEVNTSGEESKFGVAPGGVQELISSVKGLPNLRLEGLMTIGPLIGGQDAARRSFQLLRHLRDESGSVGDLPELSMGMSQDFEIAIEEGATMIRVGTAIFGTRD